MYNNVVKVCHTYILVFILHGIYLFMLLLVIVNLGKRTFYWDWVLGWVISRSMARVTSRSMGWVTSRARRVGFARMDCQC